MSVIGLNIKYLRKKINITQEQLANLVQVKRPVIGAYEEGRAEPKFETSLKLASQLGVSLEELVTEKMNDRWWQKRESTAKKKEETANSNVRVLSITVDADNNENIEIVPLKASAGYLNGYANPEYVGSLPKFHLPMLRGGTFRAFELKGDSMLPLTEGTLVIGEYVERWEDIRSKNTYVVISKNDGIVYKRVINHLNDKKELELCSDNTSYSPYSIKADELLEIWKAKAYISTQFPDTDNSTSEPTADINQLTSMVMELQKTVNSLKKN